MRALGLAMLLAAGCGGDKDGDTADTGTETAGTASGTGGAGGTATGGTGTGGTGGTATGTGGTGTGTATGTGGTGTGTATGTGGTGTGTGGTGTGGTGTGGTGTGGTGTLPDGTYHILYSAWPNVGIDQRADVAATFSGAALQSYVASDLEQPTVGTASTHEAAVVGAVGLGRWSGGTLGGEFYGAELTYGADEAFHWIVSDQPDIAGPFGQDATYSVVGHTSPTGVGGVGLGTLDAFSLDVTPGDPPTFDIDLQATVDGEAYTLVSGPHVASTYGGWHSVWTGATSAGALCGAYCTAGVYVVFVDGGAQAMVAWQFMGTERVSGVAVLAP